MLMRGRMRSAHLDVSAALLVLQVRSAPFNPCLGLIQQQKVKWTRGFYSAFVASPAALTALSLLVSALVFP